MTLARGVSLLGLALPALLMTGCSLFFGSVKVDERSDRYTVLDPSQNDADWSRMEKDPQDPAGTSDWAFRSKSTDNVISANSSCRSFGAPYDSSTSKPELLRAQTKLLMLGITASSPRTERILSIADVPALETTLSGKMDGSPIRMRSVVLRKGRCQYDLLFVAAPQHFATSEALFSQFAESLRIRE